MTKRNKILVSVLCACVAALLVAVCCLGFTFARYTTTETETATVGIATWDISLTDSDSVSLTGVKPSADAYESNTRKSEQVVYAGTLTNSGEVAATVTSATPEITSISKSASEVTNFGDSDEYSITDVQSHITIDVYWSTTKVDNPTDTTGLTKLNEDNPITLAASTGTAYIYFDVVWTSDDDGATSGDAGDAFDTAMAEYVDTLTATVTFDVVQAADAT